MGIEVPKAIYAGYMITMDIFTGKFGAPGIPGVATTFNSIEECARFIEFMLKAKKIQERLERVDEEN